ncbi:uncharacterized protein LOC135704449 [Ochlerotatus camptorhynchus]|uniref:uncharacterized protein LOC135704449 n=1 Tax=Ochlerotatus camptorhynchus TaxID=644619 RepID=UPI0031DB2C8D
MNNGVRTQKLSKGVDVVSFTNVSKVSKCKEMQREEIIIEEHAIASKRVLKYLGVMIDDRLNFNSHVEYACQKVPKAINVVTKTTPNNSGRSGSKMRLLASVSSSILRDGGPAWVRERVQNHLIGRLAEDRMCYKRRETRGVRKW